MKMKMKKSSRKVMGGKMPLYRIWIQGAPLDRVWQWQRQRQQLWKRERQPGGSSSQTERA